MSSGKPDFQGEELKGVVGFLGVMRELQVFIKKEIGGQIAYHIACAMKQAGISICDCLRCDSCHLEWCSILFSFSFFLFPFSFPSSGDNENYLNVLKLCFLKPFGFVIVIRKWRGAECWVVWSELLVSIYSTISALGQIGPVHWSLHCIVFGDDKFLGF